MLKIFQFSLQCTALKSKDKVEYPTGIYLYKQTTKWIQRCARAIIFFETIKISANCTIIIRCINVSRERKRISRFSRHSNTYHIYSTAIAIASHLEKFINYKIPFVHILDGTFVLSMFGLHTQCDNFFLFFFSKMRLCSKFYW